MPTNCTGCNKRMTVEYALSYKKGGQVLARNNNLKQEFSTLCGHAYGRSKVFDKPLIKTS